MSAGRAGFQEHGDLDFAAGTVRGVRYWNVIWNVMQSGQLKGNAGGIWLPGENTATCLTYADHKPPVTVGCGCGFWAYWSPAAAGEACVRKDPQAQAVGVIEGYGKTVIGDMGFRSAKARILAVALTEAAISSPGNWTPPPGFFRRGPAGLDTYRALTASHSSEPLPAEPQEADLDARIILEAMISDAYPDVTVYTTPEIMLRLCPPTSGYTPPVTRCRTCGRHLPAEANQARPCKDCPDFRAELDKIAQVWRPSRRMVAEWYRDGVRRSAAT